MYNKIIRHKPTKYKTPGQSTQTNHYMTKIYDYKLQKKPCRVTATKTYDQNAPERLNHFLRIIAGLIQTVALQNTYDQIALQRCPL